LSHLANDFQCIIDFSLFSLRGLTPGQSSPNLAEVYSRRLSAILQNFSPITQIVYEMCVTKIFHFLALGANPFPKVYQNGRLPATHLGLPYCQISSPCINPHQRYPLQNILQTKLHRRKQTVNHISPVCLSACGDNKQNNKHTHDNKMSQ